MSVVVVNAGIGNLGAIPNMLKRLGTAASVTADAGEIATADRIILPGVGAFDAAMQSLVDLGLLEVLNRKALEERVPILGVCLGMALLGTGSEEGRLPGLGWIAGRAIRFQSGDDGPPLRIPHMGWNYVRPTDNGALFAELGASPRFYFAHSYHLVCDDQVDVAGMTRYGHPFVSAVHRGNISGIQFHPEKSHRFGLQVFRNFLAGLADG
ncbi:MAG: imidazole glycerol phosphate synthase subunit HisH [Candidatus Limnocylindria bacterium]